MDQVKTLLQSTSGELLGARVALDAEWSAAQEKHHYSDFAHARKFVTAVQLLQQAQFTIDEARALLEEM